MRIKNIELRNFRNYEALSLDTEEQFNVIYGDNGQGKTNILEAVYLCAAGRSHRTSRDGDLIRIGEKGYYIKLEVDRSDLPKSIEIAYEQNQKKKIRVNEIPIQKLGNLMGNLNAVLFSPEDLKIVKEGPLERRRFLDITVSQLRPSYFYDLQQYARILEQRNNLLREINVNPSLSDTLVVWNVNLIKTGARIMKVRNEFLSRLEVLAGRSHRALTDGEERLCIKYSPSVACEDLGDTASIEKAFEKELEARRKQEAVKQTTLCGPQRDDFDVLLNEMSIRLYGSQGQQRTAVLSLKLSEIDLMQEETGEYPVLLLDDVMSELDPNRQEYLFTSLRNIQTFITCTETDFFKNRVKIKPVYYKVRNGTAMRND